MNAKKEVPVLLLTGYLGSGKTTLLNKILANEKGIKFAVIVNDIGEVNIDAALIEKGGVVGQKDDSLVSLQNGCICCTLKMDLVEQLKEIVDMKRFDYIVIEASGICEPAPIAQTICSIPSLGPQYIENGILRLDSIVTVVDALRMKDEFSNGSDLMKKNIDEEDLASLVIQQIEFCNIILLNKAAEVEPKELEHLKQIIRAIQPKAEIFECNYGDVDLNLIVNTKKFDWETVATSAGWIQEIESERNEEHEEDDVEEAHEHHHHHDHEHDEHEHHHHHHHHYLRPICHAARRHLVNRQAVRPAHDAGVPVPGRRRSVQHARQPVHLARAQPHPRHYVPVLAHQPFGHHGARLCLPVDNRCRGALLGHGPRGQGKHLCILAVC